MYILKMLFIIFQVVLFVLSIYILGDKKYSKPMRFLVYAYLLLFFIFIGILVSKGFF